ncbi:MAG: serine/threonine protein kinase [Chloroflexi bacterium]|nr:serine/threonine protein kinase [Chloroflexota bacterium]
MNLNATQASKEGKPPAGATKFTHPSGSRPLDGYTIHRGIGRGGFGEVYFGESDGGKEVALKLICRNLEVELRGVRECLNLKHPNLVGLYDIKSDDMDDRWVVMEYVAGESLETAIDRHPDGMPRDDVLRWIHGMAAGVAYLHDHGVVHRDLKPGNILSDEGTVKIGDYGLAKFISCSRRSGQTESIGTIHYMAPEIANGRYGREIDIYAMGIMLYEMLTGNVPFEGESVGEVLMKHLTAEPDLSALDEPYRTIVARAMAKDPDKRIGSISEMVALLPAPPAGGVAGAAYTPHVAAAAGKNQIVQAVTVDQVSSEESGEEPVAKAVHDGWRNIQSWWAGVNLHPGVKTLLLVIVILGLIGFSEAWVPVLFAALLIYAVYWVVRAMVAPVMKTSGKPPRVASPAANGPSQKGPSQKGPSKEVVAQRGKAAKFVERQRGKHRRRHSWQDEYRTTLIEKSVREKLGELTGSMLLAALAAVPLSVVMGIFATAISTTLQKEQAIWIALVGTVGAWAVMLPSKRWEGRRGDNGVLRFTMLVAGLAIGALACGLAGLLMVELPDSGDLSGEGLLSTVMNRDAFCDANGAPTMLAYLAYFGFLMVILRWWRLADPLRSVRLSLWSTVWCVAWAWLLAQFWWFPQPWGVMLAGVIAMTTQLASPWVPHEERIAKQQADE